MPATALTAEERTMNFFLPIFLVILPTNGIISTMGRYATMLTTASIFVFWKYDWNIMLLTEVIDMKQTTCTNETIVSAIIGTLVKKPLIVSA